MSNCYITHFSERNSCKNIRTTGTQNAVDKAVITIKVDDATATQYGVLPEFTFTVTGLLQGDTLISNPTLSTDADMKSAGTFEIIATGADAGDNYNITCVPGTLTVEAYTEYVGGKTYRTLTFDTNGGSEIDSIRKAYGTTIDLTGYTPTRKGYEFSGWYSDEDLTEAITSIRLTSDTTTYAGWTEIVVFPFEDVLGTDWFYEDVAYAWENGLMEGTADTAFSPHGITTRGQLVTILWRLAGEPAGGEKAFDDVQVGTYYSEAVAWAAETGIAEGYGNGCFGPDDPLTREQMATILWRYAKYKGYDVSVGEDTNILSYTDSFEVSEYAVPAMQWACGAGIINGKGNGVLDPQGSAERCQAAAILHRFCTLVLK